MGNIGRAVMNRLFESYSSHVSKNYNSAFASCANHSGLITFNCQILLCGTVSPH